MSPFNAGFGATNPLRLLNNNKGPQSMHKTRKEKSHPKINFSKHPTLAPIILVV